MSTLPTGRDDAAVPQRARLLPTAQRKSLIAVVAGNFLEWFDWTLYALLTTYLAANFFNIGDPQSAVLSTLAVFAGGFLARPLGGLIFGVVGDKLGRKASLVICMLLMGAGSLMIALIPSYDSIGVWASVLLLTARLAQGIAHGGESGNAYTYLAEIAPAKKRGLWGSSIMMTMLLGIMAATALSILLTSVFPKAEMLAYGWRYAFAAGALLAIFALYLRSQAVESGFFVEAKATHGAARTVTKRQLIIIAVRILMLSLLTNVLYYTWVSFASSFAISGKGMDPNGAYIATFAAQTLAFIALPFMGWLSDRIGRRRQLTVWAVAVIVVVFPISAILTSEPWTLFVSQGISLLVWAIQSSIHSTIMAEQAPTEARATSVGIWTSVGAALSGGTAPYLYTWLSSMQLGWGLLALHRGAGHRHPGDHPVHPGNGRNRNEPDPAAGRGNCGSTRRPEPDRRPDRQGIVPEKEVRRRHLGLGAAVAGAAGHESCSLSVRWGVDEAQPQGKPVEGEGGGCPRQGSPPLSGRGMPSR